MPNHLDVVKSLSQVYMPSNLDDDTRRKFTYMLAQTLKAQFPSEGEWGCKKYLDGPQSSDVVMIKGAQSGYDVMTGSSGNSTVIFKWDEIPLDANNIFIPVDAYDWLKPVVPPVEPPVNPPTEEPDQVVAIILQLPNLLNELSAKINSISAQCNALSTQIAQIKSCIFRR